MKPVFKAHRLRRRLIGRLPGRHRARLRILSSEFKRPLVRLRPRVAIKHLVGEGRRREFSRQRRPRFGVIQITRVRQRFRLFSDHSAHALVRVSQAIHRDSRREIQKFASLGVEKRATLSPNHDFSLPSSVRL